MDLQTIISTQNIVLISSLNLSKATMSDNILNLTGDTFEAAVTGSDTIIIDFWAPWCGPCRAFAPTFEAVADEHTERKTGVVFAKVNTEAEQGLGAAFNIRSIPTLMVIRQKVVVFEQPGMLSKGALEQILDKVAELDMVKVHAEIATTKDTPQ
jgi:thioredoxin